jgi:hypothetical protein
MRSGRVQGVVRTAEVTKTDIVRLIVGDIGTGLGGEVAA